MHKVFLAMKYAQIVFSISFVSAVSLLAGDQQPKVQPQVPLIEVAFASKTHVKELQVEISRDLYKRYIVKNVVKGALGAGCIAACYLCHRDYKIVPITAIKNQIVPVPYGWWDTFWNFGTLVCQGVVINHMQYLMYTKIFNDCSIEWFSQNQTSIDAMYEELAALRLDVEHIKQQLMHITTYQADRYAYSLIHMHNAFVVEVEKLLGYINYKSDVMRIAQTHVYGDAYIGAYLYQRIQDVAQQLHEIRQQYIDCTTNDDRVLEIIKMFEAIQSFSIELTSSVTSFKRIEVQLAAI